MLTTFLPIFITAVVAVALAIIITLIARWLGPKHPNPRKTDTYECGITPEKPVIQRFDVRYYVIAILFIAFDVEVIFLYPWAVAYGKLGWFGFIEMAIFVIILLFAYFYAIKRGVFNWDPARGRKVIREDDPWDQDDLKKTEDQDA